MYNDLRRDERSVWSDGRERIDAVCVLGTMTLNEMGMVEASDGQHFVCCGSTPLSSITSENDAVLQDNLHF